MKNKYLALFGITLILLLLAAASVEGSPAPTIAGAQIYPADDIWNVPVDNLPVDTHSADYVRTIGASSPLHPDFGSGLWDGYPIGIPYNVVNGSQAKKSVSFDYADESDIGPYPIPDSPLIEGGSDHHILILDSTSDILYELYAAEKQSDGSWHAGSGAIFNLSDYALRPAGWTSADAAGLPILPGLVRYDEVNSGQINHAIRFTAPQTRNTYVWPARHEASSLTGTAYPPMGQRFRLKATFNTSGYSPQDQVILNALKKYGMILADNGASWYISGAPDERWNNDVLHTLTQVKGSDFEAVDVSSLMTDPNSGKTNQSGNPTPSTGSIAVTSIPSGATILLDGTGKGTTPATLTDIPTGSHTILLKKSGYSDYSTNVMVNLGKTTNLSVNLTPTTPSTGSIAVTSTPSGAMILLDGTGKGTTPATLTNIPTGNHTVLLRKSGYSDYSTKVMVDSGKTTNLSINLTPSVGSISVRSTPSGATVLLDGTGKGTTPATLNGIPTGNHTVLLKKSGYSDYSTSITVNQGKVTNLSVNLLPSTGSISVKSTPSGATIILDGKGKGTTPATLSGISVGNHTVLLKKNGYFDYLANITVNLGKISNLSVNLLPSTGSLSVKSTPSGATILLDGTGKGITPATLTGISIGNHTVLLKKSGYKNYPANVTVSSGKTASISATLQKSGQ